MLDALVWALALVLATLARFDFQPGPANESGLLAATLIAITLQIGIGLALGLYRRRYHYGSFDEVQALALSIAAVGVTLTVVARLFGGGMVPRSVPMMAAFAALVLAAVVRYAARIIEEVGHRPESGKAKPIVVVGAGRSGEQIIRTMLGSESSPYLPVAVADDDPRKARLRLHGLRVQGTSADALDIAQRHDATAVLVAIPSIDSEALVRIADPLVDAGLDVLVLPPVEALLGHIGLADIRPVTISDLLGRHPADIDTAAIAEYVRGKRVLVTGAGGSIGSELCRQLQRYAPASLVMLDRNETGLHSVQLSIEGRALLDAPSIVLADIRDRDRLFGVFQAHRPEVVFHAAALKHLPLLEHHPVEAWQTNVVGTMNVLEAAEAAGVRRLVNISTDKAADPISVLGFSKRICERLTAAAAVASGETYVSVRFGNVLGSSGSMLTTFEHQVASGGPITVTHDDVARYFMTVEEAVALTIQAGAVGEAGEVLVLDMGEPVRIMDVAERLAAQAPAPVDIVVTGLRPGEKLNEVLLGADERDERPRHPLISQVRVPPLRFEEARAACTASGRLSISPATLEVASAWGLKVAEMTDVGDASVNA
ncbi:MAG: polysaccharide biosynthesis protein [Actinomycetota bacterium]|nr:polysaccharide biosynthesis protein [Actinomycetota bacterium]